MLQQCNSNDRMCEEYYDDDDDDDVDYYHGDDDDDADDYNDIYTSKLMPRVGNNNCLITIIRVIATFKLWMITLTEIIRSYI